MSVELDQEAVFPEGQDSLTDAILELDYQNNNFFEAVQAWVKRPTNNRLEDLGALSVGARLAFQHVIETVAYDETDTEPQEKATLLAGIIISNESKRIHVFSKLVPDIDYGDIPDPADLAVDILSDIEEGVDPDDLCEVILGSYVDSVSEDITELCSHVARTKKGQFAYFTSLGRRPLLELSKQIGATTAGTVLAAMILRKWNSRN